MKPRWFAWFVIGSLLFSCTVVTCCSHLSSRPNKATDFKVVNKAHDKQTVCEQQVFRDQVAHCVRQIADGAATIQWPQGALAKGSWDVQVSVWYQGARRATGRDYHQAFGLALKSATLQAIGKSGLQPAKLQDARFVIDLPRHGCSILEYHGTGKELTKGLVAVRRFDRWLLRQQIIQSKQYLFRVIDGKLHGAHKFYYASTDTFANRLHTIYTASLVFTLIKIREMDSDPGIDRQIRLCGDFLLSMQSKSQPPDASYGAFHYSCRTETQKLDRLFVVGTTAKTIFTLLELYRLTGQVRYLQSAKLAANWLLTMQQPDGTMRAYLRQRANGSWTTSRQFSMLYTGQALSAFSRIYRMTGQQKYLHAAQRIARSIAKRVPKDGTYMGDDYRAPNPISSSWAVLSLYDFYEASGDGHYGDIAFSYSHALLRYQLQDVDDLTRCGRWQGSFTSSGNGWLNEVMSQLYLGCLKYRRKGCEQYRDATLKVTRWVMQQIYAGANLYRVRNPDMARGGISWSSKYRYVRTDSVCHGANAFVNILRYLGANDVFGLPERPKVDSLF